MSATDGSSGQTSSTSSGRTSSPHKTCVSQRVAEALALTLTGEEQRQLTRRYTENPDAYGAYVRGRYFWNTGTAEGYRKAVEDFQRAIRLDPGYSLAFAGLADSYNLLGSYGEMPMREAHQQAKAAAQKAVDLDDQVAEAHTSLGAIIARTIGNGRKPRSTSCVPST